MKNRTFGIVLLFVFILGVAVAYVAATKDETVEYVTNCELRHLPFYSLYAQVGEEMFTTQYKVKGLFYKDGKLKIVWKVLDKNNKYREENNKKLQVQDKNCTLESNYLLREKMEWFKSAIYNKKWLDERGYDHFEDVRDENKKPFWLRKVKKD